ncbi:hypothetical protein Tco_0050490, partial [Tanacetum coccineum]
SPELGPPAILATIDATIIFDSLVKQFWSTATLRSPELGPPAILATIDETPYTITEDSVRSQLQLADDGGIDDLPIAEIYSGMDNLGYVTEGKLTFYKNKLEIDKDVVGNDMTTAEQLIRFIKNQIAASQVSLV